MSNGKINYELGLESSGFLSKIVGANQALQLFQQGLSLAGKIGGRAFEQINKGGALQDQSNRTRESVKDLFQLGHAFEMSGVAAGSVPATLQRFRQSLSGVGEMGENTAEAFKLLGLNITDLGKMNAPEALQAILGGLGKLDRNTAAGVASKIFGRGSGGDILQLASDSEDFAENLKESARQAEVMAANAPAFDRLGDTLGKIKLQADGMFLDLAVKITPILQGALDMLLNPGSADRFGEILELSLTVGFGKAINFFSHGLQRIFAGLPDLIVGAINLSAAAGLQAMGKLVTGPAGQIFGAMLPGGVGPMLQLIEGQGGGINKLAKFIGGTGFDSIKSGVKKGIAAEVVDIVDVAAEEEKLKGLFAGAKGRNPGAPFPLNEPVGLATTDLLAGAKGGAGGEGVNALRRIGFGSGGDSDVSRSARQTAANTARLVEEVKTTNRLIFDKFGNGYELPND